MNFIHNFSPLLLSKYILDVRSVYSKDTLQFISIPLFDYFIALWYVIYHGLDIYILIGMKALQSQILTIGEHLVAKTRFNVYYLHILF